jgi:hypothetical protein
LKPAAGAAGTQIVAAELLDQFLVAMHEAQSLLDRGFRIEIPSGACSTAQKQNPVSNSRFFMASSCRVAAPPKQRAPAV